MLSTVSVICKASSQQEATSSWVLKEWKVIHGFSTVQGVSAPNLCVVQGSTVYICIYVHIG